MPTDVGNSANYQTFGMLSQKPSSLKNGEDSNSCEVGVILAAKDIQFGSRSYIDSVGRSPAQECTGNDECLTRF